MVVTVEKLKYEAMEVRNIEEKTRTMITGMTMPRIVAMVTLVEIFKFLEERFSFAFLLIDNSLSDILYNILSYFSMIYKWQLTENCQLSDQIHCDFYQINDAFIVQYIKFNLNIDEKSKGIV